MCSVDSASGSKLGRTGKFLTTHWSVVLSAGVDGSNDEDQALAKLCQVYWYPLYVFTRRQGYSPHNAQDLTQGAYDLVKVIARGGMGVVYKARQRGLSRWVALKMILAGSLASRAFVQRFQTEAQMIARLRHPNIVSIHELGEEEGQSYFAMEYIEGEDLAERVAGWTGPLAAGSRVRPANCRSGALRS